MTPTMLRYAFAFLSAILLIPAGSAAQEDRFREAVYATLGPDTELISGLQYRNLHPRARGHPYFGENRFREGSVTLHDRTHEGVQLKYNLKDQRLELSYSTFSGGLNHLVLPAGPVDSFELGTFRFRKLRWEGTLRFVQVIRYPRFTCLAVWDKDVIPLGNDPSYREAFTRASASWTLVTEGDTSRFVNRKGFSNAFPAEDAREIRKLLRQRRCNFRKPDADKLLRDLEAVAALLERRRE